MTVNPDERNAELQAWRARHFGELDKTLEILKTIRDNPDSKDKDRVDAAKSIARILDAMSPEKIDKGPAKPKNEKKHELTDDEWDDISRRLSN